MPRTNSAVAVLWDGKPLAYPLDIRVEAHASRFHLGATARYRAVVVDSGGRELQVFTDNDREHGEGVVRELASRFVSELNQLRTESEALRTGMPMLAGTAPVQLVLDAAPYVGVGIVRTVAGAVGIGSSVGMLAVVFGWLRSYVEALLSRDMSVFQMPSEALPLLAALGAASGLSMFVLDHVRFPVSRKRQADSPGAHPPAGAPDPRPAEIASPS